MEHSELNTLISELHDMLNDTSPKTGHWSRFWELKKRIYSGLKEIRYPRKEDKDVAWKEFNFIVDQAIIKRDENYERIKKQKKEFEDKSIKSENVRNIIENQAAEASRNLSCGACTAIAQIFILPLTIIDSLIKKILDIKDKSELDQTREELNTCNQQLKKAWGNFSDLKNEMLHNDRQQAYETLKKADEQLKDAWEQWREAKTRFQAENHERFLERVRNNIQKLESKLENSRSYLEHQETHLAELKNKYDTANDDFRERCSGWIEECEEKIKQVEEDIERFEGWIEEENRKMN